MVWEARLKRISAAEVRTPPGCRGAGVHLMAPAAFLHRTLHGQNQKCTRTPQRLPPACRSTTRPGCRSTRCPAHSHPLRRSRAGRRLQGAVRELAVVDVKTVLEVEHRRETAAKMLRAFQAPSICAQVAALQALRGIAARCGFLVGNIVDTRIECAVQGNAALCVRCLRDRGPDQGQGGDQRFIHVCNSRMMRLLFRSPARRRQDGEVQPPDSPCGPAQI
ncbi:MAG: hypothetical protein QOJ04_4451 [Caballeronia sp.]|nr:hypothetical protein [Caballeronia sp.]